MTFIGALLFGALTGVCGLLAGFIAARKYPKFLDISDTPKE